MMLIRFRHSVFAHFVDVDFGRFHKSFEFKHRAGCRAAGRSFQVIDVSMLFKRQADPMQPPNRSGSQQEQTDPCANGEPKTNFSNQEGMVHFFLA
jgi:hypothetical protein